MSGKRLLHVFAVVALGLWSPMGFAFILPCSLGGYVEWSPGHPGPDDVLYFTVGLPPPLFGPNVRSAVNVPPGNVIEIDALALDSDIDVPGYQRNVHFGPLPPGEYTVRLTARTYDPDTRVATDPCDRNPYVSALTVGTTSRPVSIAPVVEFYNAARDHYFITQTAGEIADLDNGVHAGWQRTGQAFSAYVPFASDNRGVNVSRLYAAAPLIDSHFFTPFGVEVIALEREDQFVNAWRFEAPDAFEIAVPDDQTGACPDATTPVYRLWNGRVDTNHRYTTDRAIRDTMLARGYIAEGIGPDAVFMCAPAAH